MPQGTLYGTTSSGGSIYNDGTVFEIAAGTHEETVLYSFGNGLGSNNTDGTVPLSNLIMDAAGNLYGTTSLGGACGGYSFRDCGRDASGIDRVFVRFQ